MIRQATESDIPAIHNLAVITWKAHYPGIISMDQVEYMLHKFYSAGALREQMQSNQRYWLTENNGDASGYLSESDDGEGNYFLHKFYLLPETQHKGIGKIFFNTVFNNKPDLRTIRLNVNRKNFKSVNFYFHLGFIIEKLKDESIGNGYEVNDFVMCFKK